MQENIPNVHEESGRETEPSVPEKLGRMATEESLRQEQILQRKTELISNAYRIDSDKLTPELIDLLSSAIAEGLTVYKKRLPPAIKAKFPTQLLRLEHWLEGIPEDQIAVMLNSSEKTIRDWADSFPRRVAETIKWEELLALPSIAEHVPEEVKPLGPIDPLSNPTEIRTEIIDGREFTVKVLPSFEDTQPPLSGGRARIRVPKASQPITKLS